MSRLLSTLVCATACATAQPGSRLYLLTPTAIQGTGAHDLYDAVEQLRPGWLHSWVTVFYNEREWGGRESLREFGPDKVSSVHFIPQGHPRPGAGSAALSTRCPAIQVKTGE